MKYELRSGIVPSLCSDFFSCLLLVTACVFVNTISLFSVARIFIKSIEQFSSLRYHKKENREMFSLKTHSAVIPTHEFNNVECR